MKMHYVRRRPPPRDSLNHEVVKLKMSFQIIRWNLMAFSLIGVILAFFIQDSGSNPQCAIHMDKVDNYYSLLSMLMAIYFSVLLCDSVLLMPFITLTLALFHYFLSLLCLVIILVQLFLGSKKCDVFLSENPIPLMGSCVIAFICFLWNMGIAFHIHLRPQDPHPPRPYYCRPPRIKLITLPGEFQHDSYL